MKTVQLNPIEAKLVLLAQERKMAAEDAARLAFNKACEPLYLAHGAVGATKLDVIDTVGTIVMSWDEPDVAPAPKRRGRPKKALVAAVSAPEGSLDAVHK